MAGNRKLGRKTAHRMLMLRGLVTYLLENGSLETTYTRAKEVSALAEQMITLGKNGSLAARRQALAFITKETVVKKVFTQLASDYEDRNGGYTQIYKLGPRRGDAAEMALIRLVAVEKKEEEAPAAPAKAKKSKKAAEEVAPVVEEAPVEEAPVEEAPAAEEAAAE